MKRNKHKGMYGGLALYLVAVLSFCLFNVNIYAEDTSVQESTGTTYSNESYAEKESVLNALGFIDIVETNDVTRGEFASAVAKLLNLDGIKPSVELPFNDLSSDGNVDDHVGILYEFGIISDAEEFRPNDNITELEAMKILVLAMGYNIDTEEKGGWASGYTSVAAGLGFTGFINGDGNMSRKEFVSVLYKALTVDVRVLDLSRANRRITKGGTALEEYHDIITIEGFVEANERTGLYSSRACAPDGFVTVDGGDYIEPEKAQHGMQRLADYLGYKVKLYVSTKSDDENVYAYQLLNYDSITIPAEDVTGMSDFRLITYDESHNKNYKLTKDYQVIYNGVAADGFEESDFDFVDGTFELVDTDRSGSYNIIHIRQADYIVVGTFTADGDKITDVNGHKFGKDNTSVLDFTDSGVKYDFLISEDGKDREADISEISKYNTLAIWMSRDGEYIKVKGFTNKMSGTIEVVDEDELQINGQKYKLSDYAKSKTWSVGGGKIDFLLTETGNILYTEKDENAMLYGYMMGYYEDDDMDRYIVRLLTANGEKIKIPLAKKVSIDGHQFTARAAAESGTLEKYQLIRYTSSNDELKRIDTAQKDKLYEKNLDPYNSLRMYGNREAMWYGISRTIYPNIFIAGAPIFNVPTQLKNDKEHYSFSSDDFFIEGLPSGTVEKKIDVDIYDITDERTCGAIVRYNDANPNKSAPTLLESDNLAVVDSVVKSINEDGDIVNLVTVVEKNHYNKYYFSTLLQELYEEKQRTIKPGDIVRYASIGNTFTNIQVEFNVNDWALDESLDSDSKTRYVRDNGSDGSIVYYAYGTLENYTNSMIVIKRDAEDLKDPFYTVNFTDSIVMCYDKDSNSVKPLNRNDLLSIHNANEDIAYKVVAVTRYFHEIKIVVFYKM